MTPGGGPPSAAAPADWSPAAYLAFGAERERPARDLLGRVPLAAARRVADVGCGPGNSTALLLQRFPEAEILGLDTSPAMLEEARARVPGARFAEADAARWTPEAEVDLVFSNAAYQWVPDHLEHLERALRALRPGGVLAVQMPDNVQEPSHRLMAEVAALPRWADRLAAAARAPLPSPSVYFDRLKPLAASVDLWRTTYHHPMAGAGAIVEMVRSTGLRPFLEPLGADEAQAFLEIYRRRIATAYPQGPDGLALLGFPRLFIVAVRGPADP